MNLVSKLAAGAAVLGLIVGASPARAADPGITDTQITIGLFAPLSGPLAAFGRDALYAAQMWYEETNKKGGIHGRQIKTIIEDDKANPNETVAVVKKLVTVDHVFLLNGGSSTPAAVAAQEFVTREKVPYAMLNAAGDSAVIPPTRYVFGAFGGTQRTVGSTIAQFAIEHLKAKRIAFLTSPDDFGAANSAAAEAVAKRLGAQIVILEKVSPRATDVTAPMVNVRGANPDLVISTLYPQVAPLIAQKYAEFGMKVPLVMAVQGIPLPALFAKNVGNDDALKNFYYGSPLNDLTDGPKQQKWIQMYKSYYPDRKPGAFMTYGLPSAMSIVRALDKAGRDVTRESFVDAMETLNFDTGVVAGPIAFGPHRRDGDRASIFIKFDGKNYTLTPGVYYWNGTDGM